MTGNYTIRLTTSNMTGQMNLSMGRTIWQYYTFADVQLI